MKAQHVLQFSIGLVVAAAASPGLAAESTPAPVATVAPKPAAAPPPLSPRFQQVRDRIDGLFRYRDAGSAALDPRFNPFRPPGAALPVAVAVSTVPGAPAAEIVATPDLILLQQSVATLKVSGVFEINGRLLLVVNTRTYKEGDVIQAQSGAELVYLRVRQIARNSITLALNEAEMTLKF